MKFQVASKFALNIFFGFYFSKNYTYKFTKSKHYNKPIKRKYTGYTKPHRKMYSNCLRNINNYKLHKRKYLQQKHEPLIT